MLSIVIPTRNEANALPRTLPHTISRARNAAFELIVSDCDSVDATREIAAQLGAKVIRGGRNRADALNRGAKITRGDVLLFLHADTLLPNDFVRRIDRALLNPRIVGGAFDFMFAPHPRQHVLHRVSLMIVVLCNRFRFRWSRNFYGDQAIFVRRDVFDRLGGFAAIELLEDLRFSNAMNRVGKTAILSPPVQTSARRFIHRGVLRQLFRDMMLLVGDSLGMRPRTRWARYNQFNHRTDIVTFRDSVDGS
ncbi:TIGR04283 family arsenosugar biosynthesis glycosyltransferase [soil metagenome]